MDMGLAVGLAALLAAQAADPAAKPLNLSRATAGHTYYNRPGAELASHDRDLLSCIQLAGSVRSVDQQMGTGGLLGGAIADAADKGVMAASLENCMVVHGWRVVRPDAVEGEALSKLPSADLRSKLAPWIGAARPRGVVVRAWRNEAANGSINHFALRPGHTRRGQLSLLAIDSGLGRLAADGAAGPSRAGKPAIDPKWKKGSLKPAELGGAPAGSGIVILTVKGMGMTRGNGFVFQRVSPDPNVRAASLDRAPDRFEAGGGALSGSRTLAFALPPGRWRIASEINGLMELNYCLGSPSFELKAGEVLYAGLLDLKSENLRPDLALEPVRGWLAGTPAAAAVKPASYVNGSRGPCGPNSIYALEFEGAPFEPGYALGSRASGADEPTRR